MLFRLPDGHTAEAVRLALANKIRALWTELRRSLTWDQGKEMAEHARFTIDTGVQVYFCDPKSPLAEGQQREHCESVARLAGMASVMLGPAARGDSREYWPPPGVPCV